MGSYIPALVYSYMLSQQGSKAHEERVYVPKPSSSHLLVGEVFPSEALNDGDLSFEDIDPQARRPSGFSIDLERVLSNPHGHPVRRADWFTPPKNTD